MHFKKNFILLLDSIVKIKELLSRPRNIVIIGHENPDGDAVGSSLALQNIFLQLGHKADVLLPNEYPSFLAWMPGNENIVIYDKQAKDWYSLFSEAELIFCVDFNDPSRINHLSEKLSNSKAVKILIDHHLNPEDFCDINFSETDTSSTCELIYDFIGMIEAKDLINKHIAECLYVGIMTDTGSFSYSCNYPKTYLIVAELMRFGIDVELIHRRVYDTYSELRMRLLGFSLSERLKVFPEYHTAYIYLTSKDLLRFDHQIGDTEGIVNFALSISGIYFAALFVQKKDFVKISLRSKGVFHVNTFASRHFNGGGHRNASGGLYYKTMEDTLSFFESILPNYKNELAGNNENV